MKRILVPVDFSDTSKNALIYATKLFKNLPMEITVLHVYGTKSTALLMKSIDGILIDDAKRDIKTLLDEVQKESPQIVFKTQLAKNYPVSVITSLGNSGDFDFIVMGTKGASGLKEVFMGSIAGGVISKTQAPVVVVPANYTYTPPKDIAFAISDKTLSSFNVVEPLRKIALTHQSKIEVLHIAKHQTPNIKDTLKHIEDIKHSITYIYGTKDINEELNNHLSESNASLLCLIRSKKDFFDALLDGSVTLKQTFNSPVPLLVLHN